MNKILIVVIVICLITAAIVYFLRDRIFKSKQIKPEQIKKMFESKKSTKSLKEIEKYSQEVSVVLCYASWCGHCPAVKEWYSGLVDSSPLPNVNFTMVEEANIPPEILDILEGFPTILVVCNGSVDKYPGNRNKEALLSYLEKI